uniref:Uncharacterized protein n=1 Tax=Sphaerodactylus townsendi TaxID=933632 RepID=A0ACB8F7A1_9SAUR
MHAPGSILLLAVSKCRVSAEISLIPSASETPKGHAQAHSIKVHSKDKKYVCKVCSRVFMSAASVGIKHGSRRHGICLDCSGQGGAGHLNANGEDGLPDELYGADGPYAEDPDGLKGEGEEDTGDDEGLKWKDDIEISQDDLILDDDKDGDGDDSPPEHESSAENDKDFTWIS